MRDFFILLRVQALGLINSLAPRARAGKGAGRGLTIALIALAAIVLVALLEIYLFITALALSVMGLTDAVPAIALLCGSLSGVAFAFAKTRGVLFETRDFDQVMSLPIAQRVVVGARIATLYGAAIVTSALFMIPFYVGYFLATGADAARIAIAAVTIVGAPLIPVSIAIFLSFALTALTVRFRHANITYIVASVAATTVLVVAIYGFSFTAGPDSEAVTTLGALAGGVAATVSALWPPAGWATRAIIAGDLISLVLFVAASAAAVALTVEVLQRAYLTLTALLTVRRKRTSRAGAPNAIARTRTPFQAQIAKELHTLAGIPAYAVNCLFGYVFMIIIAVVLAVVGLRDVLMSGVIDGVALDPEETTAALGVIYLIIPWGFALFSGMSPTAACSVSIEGSSAWLLSCAPLSPRTLLGAKLAVNAVPTIVILVASALCLLVAGEVDALCAVSIVVVAFGVFYLFATLALALDVRRPNVSWASPNEVVKRGAPILVCTLGTMALSFVGGGLVVMASPAIGIEAAYGVNIAIGIVSAVAGQLIFERTCRTTRLFTA